jgi:phage FluMu protein gp41
MFISNLEKSRISARLHLLEEIVKGMTERLRVLEATSNELTKKDKIDLEIRAKKLAHQKERQREYNRAYKAKVKARKEAAKVQA